jgi:hypothetical protein
MLDNYLGSSSSSSDSSPCPSCAPSTPECPFPPSGLLSSPSSFHFEDSAQGRDPSGMRFIQINSKNISIFSRLRQENVPTDHLGEAADGPSIDQQFVIGQFDGRQFRAASVVMKQLLQHHLSSWTLERQRERESGINPPVAEFFFVKPMQLD